MRLDYFMVAMAIFSLFFLVFVMMIEEVNVNYDMTMEENYSDIYNSIDDVYETSEEVKEKSIDYEIQDEDTWETMTKGSYSGSRSGAKASYGLAGELIGQIGRQTNVPDWITNILKICMGIMISFAIIYLIMRFTPR